MEDFVVRRRATYRQKTPKPTWRAIPDDAAEQLFSVLRCHRDRALISFWLSTGARAAELLGLRHGDLDVGARTITVVSKGSRAREAIPASMDSFAWLALYLAEDRPPLVEGGPVWWTRTAPARPLTYHAARAVLPRAACFSERQRRRHVLAGAGDAQQFVDRPTLTKRDDPRMFKPKNDQLVGRFCWSSRWQAAAGRPTLRV
jgi:hypothetical protein